MKFLQSIKQIEKRFNTGEEPVLVACNDHNSYICKYPRYSGSANKMVCELLGSEFARSWKIDTPEIAMVNVLPIHYPKDLSGSYFSRTLLGSRQRRNVIDITPTSISSIPSGEKLCKQLLKIALFDFWTANEDRNANNANLMYDLVNNSIISIDYGCCFNTATFDFPLSQLTETDSILSSDLFKHISQKISPERVLQMADILTRIDYLSYIHDCQTTTLTARMDETDNAELGLAFIPSSWNIKREVICQKLKEMLDTNWTEKVKDNFLETLKNVLNHD